MILQFLVHQILPKLQSLWWIWGLLLAGGAALFVGTLVIAHNTARPKNGLAIFFGLFTAVGFAALAMMLALTILDGMV